MMVFTELFEGRTETGGVRRSARIPYLVESLVGDIDESILMVQADAAIPMFYNGLVRSGVEIDEHINEKMWRIIVSYDQYDPTFCFDTSGGTQHITHSKGTRKYEDPAWTCPQLHNAICWDGQNINGIDIQVPVYNFSETHNFLDAQVTPAYKAVLFQLTGCVNSDPFRGFQPGEVLFLGAGGTKRGTDFWELQFRFAASQNLANYQIGNVTVVQKKGWEFAWVMTEPDVDDDAKKLIAKPVGVYVEKVYDEKPFANLGLGS